MSDALHRSELEFLMLGKKIGKGTSRSVYVLNDPYSWAIEHKGGPFSREETDRRSPFVVKVEKPGGSHQNHAEWLIWSHVETTPLAKWLAPCISISPCGLYLIQARVDPLRTKEIPTHLPAFLQDVTRDNLGWLDGRIVCCDYGWGVGALTKASLRMRKVRL